MPPRSPGGGCRPAGGNRFHQHPPGVAPGDAAGRAHAGAFAGLRAGRRLPDSRSADGAAGRDPRRFALHGDRGGVDRRQGHARPDDAGAARAIRATASTSTRDTRPVTTSTRSRDSAIRMCTGVRFGRRLCLIGWSRKARNGQNLPRCPARGVNPGAHRPRRHAEKAEKLARQGKLDRHRRMPARGGGPARGLDDSELAGRPLCPRRPARLAAGQYAESPHTSWKRASTRRPLPSTRSSSS